MRSTQIGRRRVFLQKDPDQDVWYIAISRSRYKWTVCTPERAEALFAHVCERLEEGDPPGTICPPWEF